MKKKIQKVVALSLASMTLLSGCGAKTIPTLENGDSIEITDNYGRKVNYIVYDKHVVSEGNTKDTSQVTHGKREITLITCTNESNANRYIIKAREEGK